MEKKNQFGFLKLKQLLVILAIFVFMLSVEVSAATFTVNSELDANDIIPNDGKCETQKGNGVCTLRAALQETNASPGADSITLPAGIFKIFKSLSSSFKITDSLNLIGSGSNSSIVDGMKLDHVFIISPSDVNNKMTVSIQGISIQNGKTDSGTVTQQMQTGQGGGLYVENVTNLNLTNLVVRNNLSNRAGSGVYLLCRFCKTVIKNCLFENNGPTKINEANNFGGGFYFESSESASELLFLKSSVRANTAANGGGLFLKNGTITIRDSSITGNFAIKDKVHLNSLSQGGGISVEGAMTILNIVNSTISGNSSERMSGGIDASSNSKLALYNATITNNRAIEKAGGINGSIFNSVIMTVENSIIAGNTDNGVAPDCAMKASSLSSNGYNLIGDETGCTINKTNGDIIGSGKSKVDPQLAILADYGGVTETHALNSGSPAIDAGNPNGCLDEYGVILVTDQRGLAGVSKINRARDGGSGMARCDIDAYEVGSTVPVADAGANQTAEVDSLVILDGSGSFAMQGITHYSWLERSNSSVILNNPNTVKPNFTSPAQAGLLTFQLTITDAIGQQDNADVQVIIINSGNTTAPNPESTKNDSKNNNANSGGCSMISSAEFDPIFIVLLLLTIIHLPRLRSYS